MPLSSKLGRRISAADESSDDEEYYQVTDRSSSESLIETGEGGNVISSDDEDEDHNDGSDIDSPDASNNDVVQKQMSKVSFGALAKAQEALSNQQSTDRKRKRGENTSKTQEDKLEALRERLRQIKAQKLASGEKPSKKSKHQAKSETTRSDDSENESNHDEHKHASDSESESNSPVHARSSKHAPAVQSSKRMVSRKRQVVEVKKRQVRDPRFENISGPRLDQNVVENRYAFLNDYRASEMADLRTTIKKTKDEGEKERLRKKLLSMESQEQTRKRKEEHQKVIRDHRKNEKELVKQGKQPFYLKKSEQKRIALVDRFQNMKSKQRDKVVERRRKKTTAKERKNLPFERRTT